MFVEVERGPRMAARSTDLSGKLNREYVPLVVPEKTNRERSDVPGFQKLGYLGLIFGNVRIVRIAIEALQALQVCRNFCCHVPRMRYGECRRIGKPANRVGESDWEERDIRRGGEIDLPIAIGTIRLN